MATGAGRAARVTRTGLALVHAGELVLPAAGSEAEAEQVAEDDRAVIAYHFPVEIEVVAGGGAVDVDALADLALARLAEHLDGRS
ncbi:hypothetical protein [Micromonospora profundi]|uniref:Uncharacterized protein n=1 Tax=Micromonospora profundi TaxID=1420889 RepID=A0AAJ6L1W1_9ACTN|nr:hypothetical protein [Micromonospora profundi]WLS44276.1 hypothetical protein Q3V37_23140 [Micromonospora profundi]